MTQSTHNTLLSYNTNIKHAYHVAKLANDLFNDWQEILDLNAADKPLLHVAAVLHDIGISINYYDHPRHSAYLIENARLFGLSHREQIMASLIAGWHHSSSAKHSYNKIYNEFLDDRELANSPQTSPIISTGRKPGYHTNDTCRKNNDHLYEQTSSTTIRNPPTYPPGITIHQET